ncbi:hypothetical protein BTV98_12190 [Psychrobacter sp. Cmf 22.2]|nr:hypothetical protein BTV98_12190 [Psychrobacter sp. Cmf 22.2]
MDLSSLPQNLPAWVYVCFILGIIAIAYLTGNHKKKSKSFKNISQSGSNNKQQIGDRVNKKKEDD